MSYIHVLTAIIQGTLMEFNYYNLTVDDIIDFITLIFIPLKDFLIAISLASLYFHQSKKL